VLDASREMENPPSILRSDASGGESGAESKYDQHPTPYPKKGDAPPREKSEPKMWPVLRESTQQGAWSCVIELDGGILEAIPYTPALALMTQFREMPASPKMTFSEGLNVARQELKCHRTYLNRSGITMPPAYLIRTETERGCRLDQELWWREHERLQNHSRRDSKDVDRAAELSAHRSSGKWRLHIAAHWNNRVAQALKYHGSRLNTEPTWATSTT
jgi:hypothetical protein